MSDRLPHEGRCGAKRRDGHFCQQYPVPGKRRCHYHGGRSTGAKTAEGKRRQLEAVTIHGRRSKAAREERRRINQLLRDSRAMLGEVVRLEAAK